VFSLPRWGRHRQRQKMQNIHSALKTEQMLQNNYIFICIHLTQEKNWHLVKEVIITHTNSFLKQQEQEGIILLNKKMIVTSLLY